MYRAFADLVISALKVWIFLLSDIKSLVLILISVLVCVTIGVMTSQLSLPILVGLGAFSSTIAGILGYFVSKKEAQDQLNQPQKDITRILLQAIVGSANKKETVISLSYLSVMRRKNIIAKVLLFTAVIILFVASLITASTELKIFAGAGFIGLFLILLKEEVVEYRIKKGLFGSNRYEAKELIDFLISNAKDIDFHDDEGNLKKVFLPEVSNFQTNQNPFAHGAKPQ